MTTQTPAPSTDRTAVPTPRPSDAPRQRRDPMALALAAFTRIAGWSVLDRPGVRPRAERAAFHLTRTGLRGAGAASRTFRATRGLTAPHRQTPRADPRGGDDLFDLTPDDEQQMIVDVVRQFAAEQVRPAAADADRASSTPDELVTGAVDLGMWQLAVPETLGGFSAERSSVTGVLVAEALAHGDLGIAVGCLAPAAVSTALGLWGDAEQQATYLPAFVAAAPPRAALAVVEPQPLFDPFRLTTTALRTADGYVLDGVKTLVPAAARNELFLVAAQVVGEPHPALFLLESTAAGLTVSEQPAMGLRAAQLGRLHLDAVAVPAGARLGTLEANPYADCIRLSRIAWCALSVGTAQAVLDYVVPYVNDRHAFGEPISHRQGVAFTVADMATELAGMRLATYRAAARADRGLDVRRETALARRLCADFGMAVGSDGVQLLGGHGYVREHPVERWYRDLRAVAVLDGVVLV